MVASIDGIRGIFSIASVAEREGHEMGIERRARYLRPPDLWLAALVCNGSRVVLITVYVTMAGGVHDGLSAESHINLAKRLISPQPVVGIRRIPKSANPVRIGVDVEDPKGSKRVRNQDRAPDFED
ncbi:hypothetical protein B0H13DRAFT_1904466 [Mycena leptocephala]|nr:hypothetical protein B0H13DRAFT_1904466 [Mycena leptocephala]